tara:strand:- start:3856 stop:4323 length:468 start_codon:yes stop_codon:yes gene_type:complete
MAQMGREVTCLGFGSIPIVHIHFITGRRFSSNMIALMSCLRSLGFCFHTAVIIIIIQGFRKHFGCNSIITCSHRFGKCWEVARVSFELRSARGDVDVTNITIITGFHRDFHDLQLADFDDAVQSFCFQPVQGYAAQKHDVDAGATFAVDFGKFRN